MTFRAINLALVGCAHIVIGGCGALRRPRDCERAYESCRANDNSGFDHYSPLFQTLLETGSSRLQVHQYGFSVLGRQVSERTHMHDDLVPLIGRFLGPWPRVMAGVAVEIGQSCAPFRNRRFDGVSALALVPLLLREAKEAWQGEDDED